MTHAHDRTLLASLGFSDPDKRDERHYAACKFLVQPDVLRDIAARYVPVPDFDRYHRVYGIWKPMESRVVTETQFREVTRAGCELAISKGEGPYKQTIGFADAWFMARSRAEYNYTDPDGSERNCEVEESFVTVFEVKIGVVGVDSILRQLALYKSHFHGFQDSQLRWATLQWVLATPYSLSVSDAAILRSHDIRHIRLGPRFEAFCAQQKAEASESGFEL